MTNRISAHIRANVVGYIALFCFGMASTAGALPGRNTVDSGDIRNGQVKGADLKAAAVKRAKLAENAVDSSKVAGDALTGADIDESTLEGLGGGAPIGSAGGDLTGTYPNPQIAANAVGTSEVAPDSLTGGDINESTLSGVNAASLGGFNSGQFLANDLYELGATDNGAVNDDSEVTAACDSGDPAVGGGYVNVNRDGGTTVVEADLDDGPPGSFTVAWLNDGTADGVTAQVICVDVNRNRP